jgi:hypothetical protein
MSPKRIDWNQFEVDFVRLRAEGKSIENAAAQLNVSVRSLRAHYAALGEPVPGPGVIDVGLDSWTKDDDDILRENWGFYPPMLIGRWTRHSASSVRARAAALGLGDRRGDLVLRRCLGGCGQDFYSRHPVASHRICEACVDHHRNVG